MPEKDGTPTQSELILHHLKHYGPITSKGAMDDYGVSRLAARVYDLRQQGYPVRDRATWVPTRRGKRVQVSEYFLPEEYIENHQTELAL